MGLQRPKIGIQKSIFVSSEAVHFEYPHHPKQSAMTGADLRGSGGIRNHLQPALYAHLQPARAEHAFLWPSLVLLSHTEHLAAGEGRDPERWTRSWAFCHMDFSSMAFSSGGAHLR